MAERRYDVPAHVQALFDLEACMAYEPRVGASGDAAPGDHRVLEEGAILQCRIGGEDEVGEEQPPVRIGEIVAL